MGTRKRDESDFIYTPRELGRIAMQNAIDDGLYRQRLANDAYLREKYSSAPSPVPQPPVSEYANMIMTDFIPAVEGLAVKTLEPVPKATSDLFEQARGFSSIVKSYGVDFRYHDRNTLQETIVRARNKLDQVRLEHINKSGTLPEVLMGSLTDTGLWTDNDILTRAAKAPKMWLKDVRDAADRLGFVAMPFEALDTRSYKNDREFSQVVPTFDRYLNPFFDIFAVAPPSYYSFEQHIQAASDAIIYTRRHEQAFMAVSMMLPTIRAMREEIKDQRSQGNALTKTVQSLKVQLADLEARFEAYAKEQARQKAAEQSRLVELEAQIAATRFTAWEPMLLALPEGQHFATAEWAIVGPCWGPDFEALAMELLGFNKIEGQRQNLRIKAIELWR